MSKYKQIRTKFTDRDALRRALEALEIPYEVAEPGQTLPLYGYRGKRRQETADLVVRREHIGVWANDLGFTWNADAGQFDVIISEYDDDVDTQGHGRHTLNRVKRQYALDRVYALAEAQGYSVQQTHTENGVTRLQLVRY